MKVPTYDVCVVGGAGHVGAPLAIVLASKGMRVLVHDKDEAAMATLASGAMPFLEEGGEPLLRRVLTEGCLFFSASAADIRGVPIVVITIGTPIDEFQNPRVEVIRRCVDGLLPYLDASQTIVLRSTVSPGVTNYLDQYLRERDKPLGIAFCPERVVQGRAIEEIGALAQIVSGTTPEAEAVAERLFSKVAPRIVRLAPKEAEFAKLISNAYRYIQFAAANQFFMMVEAAGVDYARVLAGLKEDYPRMRDLPGPGFAAGPCLMKDTMQLTAFDRLSFPLGSAAMTVNEGLPNFIVQRLAEHRDLAQLRVGILGMAFKADIDDKREALSYKLAKVLRFRGASVVCSDEHVKDATFLTKEQLLGSVDVAIVGVPHRSYRALDVPSTVELIDLWGVVSRR